MTIMFAGGLTFAFAPMVPEAYAQSNANLFISAENAQFDNYMVGAQVIEVVVIDPDIDDTDEGKGEPDVDVNSGDLRMTQAVDGNWYGYFADRKRAQIADQTNFGAPGALNGSGLDFGTFCSRTGTDISGAGLKNYFNFTNCRCCTSNCKYWWFSRNNYSIQRSLSSLWTL